MDQGYVDPSAVFIDSAVVKARCKQKQTSKRDHASGNKSLFFKEHKILSPNKHNFVTY
jgi:hypothetical protein